LINSDSPAHHTTQTRFKMSADDCPTVGRLPTWRLVFSCRVVECEIALNLLLIRLTSTSV